MSKTSTASKTFTCDRCEREIREGAQYVRRPEDAGTRFKTARYHPECAELVIQEAVKAKQRGH